MLQKVSRNSVEKWVRAVARCFYKQDDDYDDDGGGGSYGFDKSLRLVVKDEFRG